MFVKNVNNNSNEPKVGSLSLAKPTNKALPLKEIPDGTQPVHLGSGVVTCILGQGGMANVYEIWNKQLEVHKAVKLMHPSAGKDCLERFQTEIKICAKLNHPNIVEIHSVGEWHGLPYIEMERLDGITLENLIKTRGHLPEIVVVAAGILACRGLSFAHNHTYQLYGEIYHGIIHRDLKPGNIMFCHNGQLKIMDFGIARPLDASLHTVDGGVIGTLQYLSPEQLNVSELDVRTDIYSLGETLFEALCGYQAFPEKNVTALLGDKSKNRYKSLKDYNINASSQLIHLIHKSMSRDRENRIPNAFEFELALKIIGDKMGIDDPQSVIRHYMESSEVKKELLEIRKPFPIIPIAISISLFFILISGFIFFHRQPKLSYKAVNEIHEKRIDSISEISSLKPTSVKRSLVKKSDSIPILRTSIITKPKVNLVNTAKVNRSLSNETVTFSTPDINSQPSILQLTTIKRFQAELCITDSFSLIPALYALGRHEDVLKTYFELSNNIAKTPKIAVLALRSQIALGNSLAIDRFLSANFINEVEFHLCRAKQSISHGETEQSLSCINSAESAPRAALTYDELHRETSYLRATLATVAFDKTPNEETYKNALDKWRDVRAALVSNSSHEYLRIEREERKRMSQTYASTKDKQ